MNSRRKLLTIGSLMCLSNQPTHAQLRPFRLRVVRRGGLPVALAINDCLPGSLYLVSDFVVSDRGTKVADTLELPYRSNVTTISAIPTGTFSGRVRDDGNLGWRIEFDGVPGRSNIQIHPGNRTSQIEGCLLVGDATDDAACTVTSSRDTRDRIRGLYGENRGRPIEVRVED